MRQETKAVKKHGEDFWRQMILPTYTTPQEMHTMCNLHLSSVMHMMRLKYWNGKWFWRDHMGRGYESASKRQIYVPYETAWAWAVSFGFEPRYVDIEPEWHLNDRIYP